MQWRHRIEEGSGVHMVTIFAFKERLLAQPFDLFV